MARFGIDELSCCRVAKRMGGIKCPICLRDLRPNYTPQHEVWITVYRKNGSPADGQTTVEVLLHSADRPETYVFVDIRHALSYFGPFWVLTDCPIRIRVQDDNEVTND